MTFPVRNYSNVERVRPVKRQRPPAEILHEVACAVEHRPAVGGKRQSGLFNPKPALAGTVCQVREKLGPIVVRMTARISLKNREIDPLIPEMRKVDLHDSSSEINQREGGSHAVPLLLTLL